MTASVLTVERQTEALQRAQKHWQAERAQPRTKRAYTIALSREAGTPGTSVAQEVGKRLGWTVYDHELVEKIAQEMGLRADLLDSVDEKRRSWLLETLEEFATATPPVSQNAYVRHLVQTLLSLSVHGRCIIVGRGSPHVLPQESTLRVRLVGRLEDRIAAGMRRLNTTEAAARKWVEETERQRLHFVQEFFLKDARDPREYDLILNTSRWSVSECADLVIQALKDLEIRG